ncbi:outer membrane beta-barrel family protein [Prevotella falsenii]|uniref:outer membrane beta-barrel family protein n=1 Tax=Prevotella falsenii TaxID=515414 RepID=UPI00046947CF|nr:outer membrane beta-barrel family protein [Prevotella falsenii]
MNRIITFLVLCFSALQLTAQNIKGQVVDEQQRPLPYANVLLLTQKDSTLIKGTVTNNQGHFELAIPEVSYIIKISFIGYEPCYLNNMQGNIGAIQLKTNSTDLNAVVVKGRRPTIKVGLNKIEVNVSNSYLKYMGKATAILGKIPGLTKDLQLLEGGTPTFVLNGKPVGIKELSTIPSSEIKKIIVDSNPNAEYSATCKGVVYITTTKALENTLSTEISNASLFARNYMNIADFTLNEKNKNISNLLSVGFLYLNTTQIDNTTESVYLPASTIYSTKERHTRGQGRALNWFYAMNWDLSNKQSWGLQYSGNIGNTHTKEPTWQKMDAQSMEYIQSKRGVSYIHNIGINYKYSFNKTSSLKFIADYAHHKSADNGFANAIPSVTTSSSGMYDIAGAKLTYSTNAKWGNFSTGVFTSTMKNNGGYSYNNEEENYKTRETLYGVFTSYSKRIKKYVVQVGLRVEADKRRLESHEKGVFADSTEWKVFPNLVVNRELTKISSIGLSFGQNIGRPTYANLNPSIEYYDAISYKVGNPQLRPCISNNIKLSYNVGNLTTSVVYNYSKNKIIELPFWKEKGIDNKNIEWRPVNFEKSSSIVATAIYSYNLGSIQGDISFSCSKPFMKATFLGEERTWNKPNYNVSLSVQCPISRTSLLAFDGTFDSAYSGMVTNHRSSWTLNLTYMQQLWKEKLTLLVVANDIFHTDRSNTWNMEYNNIRTTMDSNFDTQYLMVKLNYNFGKLKLDKTKKSASKDIIDRL